MGAKDVENNPLIFVVNAW